MFSETPKDIVTDACLSASHKVRKAAREELPFGLATGKEGKLFMVENYL